MRRQEFINNGQGKKLKDYFTDKGYVLKDVAESLGVSSSDLSNVFSGKASIGKLRAQKMHDVYGFSITFLTKGIEPMFLPNNAPYQQAIVDTNNGTINQQMGLPTPETPSGPHCPSREELQQKVDKLSAQVDAMTSENSWLRSMIERLTSAKESKSE